VNSFVKAISNQIIYYLKNNNKLYKKFMKNYSLTSVVSWVSKMPELARKIKTMYEEIYGKKKKA